MVASLVYVGLQIRHNAAALRAQSAQAFADSINSSLLAMASDLEKVRAWNRARENPSALDDDERAQLEFICTTVCRSLESAFVQLKLGSLDPETERLAKRITGEVFSIRFYRDWWTRRPFGFTEQFETFVDDVCLADTARS